ncbi:MAG: hypothetical protein Q9170_005563 [Blastenia crenularia]
MEEAGLENGLVRPNEPETAEGHLNKAESLNPGNPGGDNAINVADPSLGMNSDPQALDFPRSTIEALLGKLLSIMKDGHASTEVQSDPGLSEEAAVIGAIDLNRTELSEQIGLDSPAIGALNDALAGPSSKGFRHPGGPCPNANERTNRREHCLRFGACGYGLKRKVKIFTEQELEAENNLRMAKRQTLSVQCESEHLLDSWKALWQHKKGIEQGLFLWTCEDTVRRGLQLRLIDALITGQPFDYTKTFMRNDYRSIACWVSLIGLRLHDWYSRVESCPAGVIDKSINPISPMTQIEVLIECLWACNLCKNAQVGKVLETCYKRQILVQPDFVDSPFYTSSRFTLLIHVHSIRVALYLVNLLFKHDIPFIKLGDDLDAIWTTRLSEIEVKMRLGVGTSDLDFGHEPFFRIDDFNLRDLQRRGRLQVNWTSNWDEHLRLQIKDETPILYLYWFQPGFSVYFTETGLSGELEESDRSDRALEIFRTFRLIFASNTTHQESHKVYRNLAAPEWLRLLATENLDTWSPGQEDEIPLPKLPKMSQFKLHPEKSINPFCVEPQWHLRDRWPQGSKRFHEELSYTLFPVYENRLRKLRAYMDSQQPTGLRALWKDKRNSNIFYTFWLAIFFGSLTLLFGLFALATSLAQTWAQFQSLHMSDR